MTDMYKPHQTVQVFSCFLPASRSSIFSILIAVNHQSGGVSHMSTTNPQITVLGLGTGDEDQLTLRCLEKAPTGCQVASRAISANERSSDGSDAGYQPDSLRNVRCELPIAPNLRTCVRIDRRGTNSIRQNAIFEVLFMQCQAIRWWRNTRYSF